MKFSNLKQEQTYNTIIQSKNILSTIISFLYIERQLHTNLWNPSNLSTHENFYWTEIYIKIKFGINF